MTSGYQTLNIDGVILTINEAGNFVGTVELNKEKSDILSKNRKRLIVQVTGTLAGSTFTAVVSLDFNMLVETQIPAYIGQGVLAVNNRRYIILISKPYIDANYTAEMAIFMEEN